MLHGWLLYADIFIFHELKLFLSFGVRTIPHLITMHTTIVLVHTLFPSCNCARTDSLHLSEFTCAMFLCILFVFWKVFRIPHVEITVFLTIMFMTLCYVSYFMTFVSFLPLQWINSHTELNWIELNLFAFYESKKRW